MRESFVVTVIFYVFYLHMKICMSRSQSHRIRSFLTAYVARWRSYDFALSGRGGGNNLLWAKAVQMCFFFFLIRIIMPTRYLLRYAVKFFCSTKHRKFETNRYFLWKKITTQFSKSGMKFYFSLIRRLLLQRKVLISANVTNPCNRYPVSWQNDIELLCKTKRQVLVQNK